MLVTNLVDASTSMSPYTIIGFVVTWILALIGVQKFRMDVQKFSAEQKKAEQDTYRAMAQTVARDEVDRHTNDAGAHALKLANLRSELKVEIQSQILVHDESRRPHIEALERYATLADLENAIEKVETAIGTSQQIILSRIDAIVGEPGGGQGKR